MGLVQIIYMTNKFQQFSIRFLFFSFFSPSIQNLYIGYMCDWMQKKKKMFKFWHIEWFWALLLNTYNRNGWYVKVNQFLPSQRHTKAHHDDITVLFAVFLLFVAFFFFFYYFFLFVFFLVIPFENYLRKKQEEEEKKKSHTHTNKSHRV